MDERYVGIDLHRRRSVIHVMDGEGKNLSGTRIENTPINLLGALPPPGDGVEVVVEATYSWYWAVDLLQDNGYSVHLSHPSGNDWGHRRVKNDERDARDLADLLRLGRLAEAWIAPKETRELRELVRYRAKLVQLRSGLKAQVHAVMGKEGVLPSFADIFCPAAAPTLDAMELAEPYRIRVESIRDLIELYDREVRILERLIHQRLRGDKGYEAIQALNGVGRTMAAIFCAEIGDVSRFRAPEALCSWAGLTPRHRESDTHVVRGGITKMGSRLVRWAALEAVARYHGGSVLHEDFCRIAQRRGKTKARVAVARKLLTLVYYGMRDGEIRCLREQVEAA
jgi:transposase